MTTTHLLYLHGFRSSPQSAKARQVAAWVRARHPQVVWWCPQLPPSPHDAMAQVLQGIASWPRETMAVMGSSLGGFYATQVAERTGCRAALLNPAVNPARDLAAFIGEHPLWHNPPERVYFDARFVDELHALTCGKLQRPERYCVLMAQGDEVLDWREMADRYAGAHCVVVPGSDHALSDFDQHIQGVLDFLGLG